MPNLQAHLLAGALAALLGAAATAVDAEEISASLDPEATEIHFTLGATLHTVEGSFRLREGGLRFDPATGEASGRVVVDTTSGDTGNAKRDRNMHDQVLESARFPEAVLTAERIEGTFDAAAPSQILLHGRLDLHGSSHEVTIPLEVTVEGDRFEAEGGLEVPYVAWGLKDPSRFVLRVAKSVDVTLHAIGRLGP